MALLVGSDPKSLTTDVQTVLDHSYNGVRYELRVHYGSTNSEWWVRINSGNGVNRALRVAIGLWTGGASASGGNHNCLYSYPSPQLTGWADIPANAGWTPVLANHTAFTDGWRCHSGIIRASSTGPSGLIDVGSGLFPCR